MDSCTPRLPNNRGQGLAWDGVTHTQQDFFESQLEGNRQQSELSNNGFRLIRQVTYS